MDDGQFMLSLEDIENGFNNNFVKSNNSSDYNEPEKGIFYKILIISLFVFLAALMVFSVVKFIQFKRNPYDAFIFGYKPLISADDTMGVSLPEGSLYIIRKTPFDEIKEADIISFTTEDGKFITHKVASVTLSGVRTRGETPPLLDMYMLTDENVKGKVIRVYSPISKAAQVIIKLAAALIETIIILALAFILYKWFYDKVPEKFRIIKLKSGIGGKKKHKQAA
ncbi:MAG: hypothetical protein FWF08_06405, partial [Oscillospiraceae bacterium]|nr:hypothetical protein [Oscillospiraceae bacterium]